MNLLDMFNKRQEFEKRLKKVARKHGGIAHIYWQYSRPVVQVWTKEEQFGDVIKRGKYILDWRMEGAPDAFIIDLESEFPELREAK